MPITGAITEQIHRQTPGRCPAYMKSMKSDRYRWLVRGNILRFLNGVLSLVGPWLLQRQFCSCAAAAGSAKH